MPKTRPCSSFCLLRQVVINKTRLLAIAAVCCVLALDQSLWADHKVLIPNGRSPSGIGNLSPELALIAMGEARYLGQNAEGLAVFDVGADSELTTTGKSRAGSFTVQASAAGEPLDDKSLITFSYPNFRRPNRRELREAGFQVVDDFPRGNFMTIKPFKSLQEKGSQETIIRLAGIRGVTLAGLTFGMNTNPPARAEAVNEAEIASAGDSDLPTNDPQAPKQWALKHISADVAWSMNKGTASDAIVAVIDTGVDHRHEDLHDNMWVNPGEIPGNGIDDDANGYIDDIYGMDFVDGDGDPMDVDGHGTHVAGIVGAVGNNRTGISGVTWKTRIMALRFMTERVPGHGATGSSTDAAKCIYYALDQGADIINCSFSSPKDDPQLERAIRRARDAGVVVVVAAGNGRPGTNNDVTPVYPANYASFTYNYRNVISVAAITSKDKLASFSHYGRLSVQLAAPGTTILSTLPKDKYNYSGGTSMAAPYVSGSLALMHGHRFFRHANWEQRVQSIKDGVRKLDGLSDFCSTGGTLNLKFLATPIEQWFRENDPEISSRPRPSEGAAFSFAQPSNTEQPSAAAVNPAAGASAGTQHRSNRTESARSSASPAANYAPIPGQLLADQSYRKEPLHVHRTTNLSTLSFVLDRPAQVLINASGSVRSTGNRFVIAHELLDAAEPNETGWKSSLRLLNLPSDKTLGTLATTAVIRLEPGRHTIHWRVRLPGEKNSAEILGGSGMTMLALPLAE